MKKIIIFGASGNTGKHIVNEAYKAGFKVTVVISNTEISTFNKSFVTVIVGDVFQPESYENALKKNDVVISCLELKRRNPDPVYSTGITNIIQSMQKTGLTRLICLSSHYTRFSKITAFISKICVLNIIKQLFQECYSDSLMLEKILCSSNLNWTVVCPSKLENGLKRGYYRTSINENLTKPTSLNRNDLADYIIYYMDEEKTFKSMVQISY